MTSLIYENIMKILKLILLIHEYLTSTNLKKYQHKPKNIHNEKIPKNITNEYRDKKEMT
jgi:hypothetical protein